MNFVSIQIEDHTIITLVSKGELVEGEGFIQCKLFSEVGGDVFGAGVAAESNGSDFSVASEPEPGLADGPIPVIEIRLGPGGFGLGGSDEIFPGGTGWNEGEGDVDWNENRWECISLFVNGLKCKLV